MGSRRRGGVFLVQQVECTFIIGTRDEKSETRIIEWISCRRSEFHRGACMKMKKMLQSISMEMERY